MRTALLKYFSTYGTPKDDCGLKVGKNLRKSVGKKRKRETKTQGAVQPTIGVDGSLQTLTGLKPEA